MWTDVKLNQLFDIGSSKRVLKSQWQQAGIPFYRGREVTRLSMDGFVNNELFISEELYKEFLDKYGAPKRGDIMITAIGTIGNSYIVREKDWFYFKDASVLWLKKTSDVSSKFINYWLKSSYMKKQLDEGNGATVDTLTIRKLQTLRLKLPPLAEQKRIVAILDEAFADIDAAIANTEKNLANARELFESYLNSLIGKLNLSWPEVGVDEACDSIIGCINKTAPQVDYPTPYKMIRTTNVRNGQINLDSVKYVEEPVYRQWTRRQIPQKGDVILTREAPMGEVGVLNSDENIFLGQRLVSYRADPEKLNNRFLFYCFLSGFIQGQIQKLGSGSTVLHMRVPDSKKLKIPLPTLNVQSGVVVALDILNDETSRLKNISERKITALNELKQSLLQKAFSGKLTGEVAKQKKDEAVA
jgi:type I restriction enzyme S subunit